MANRIWLNHFGRGIVSTPSNFGLTGAAPTHPELLDWLATEFVRRDWSIKAMHRLIMTSSAYRQSSQVPKAHPKPIRRTSCSRGCRCDGWMLKYSTTRS